MRGYKNNDKILLLLEHLYLYGAFTKEAVSELLDESFSRSEKRLYDLIRNFGLNHIQKIALGNQFGYYADYDYYNDLSNYLSKVYALKTTTKGRFEGYFHILAALVPEKSLSLTDLQDHLAEQGLIFNASFMQDLLNDMVAHGALIQLGSHKKYVYKLPEDTCEALDSSELLQLHKALTYFAQTAFPYSLGDQALKNLEAYMVGYRKLSLPTTPWLRVIQKGFHLTLYEELAVEFLSAIKESQEIPVRLHGKQITFIPTHIALDANAGEVYLEDTTFRIPFYAFMHAEDKVPEVSTYGRTPSLEESSTSVTQLTLKISKKLEPYKINTLSRWYSKARLETTSDTVLLDISAYPAEAQVDIIMAQLPDLVALKAPETVSTLLRERIKGGLSNYGSQQ